MRKILFFGVIFCLAACSNKSQPDINNDGINERAKIITDTKSKESYNRWCELCDSMITFGKKLLPNQHYSLLEKGLRLNKEQKIFCTLTPLYNTGDTIYIIEEINNYTYTVLFAFWNKKSGNVYGTDKIYEYRYMRYQKRSILKEGIKENCDSIFIKNDPDICSFSEKLIKTCSDWDTLQLKENNNLDGVSGGHRYMLAYRIIFLKDNKYDIKCVKIASQGNIGNEITEPYVVIPMNHTLVDHGAGTQRLSDPPNDTLSVIMGSQ